MIVLSHRGYWLQAPEKNQPVAFERSFALGFGTETDVRDCQGRLLMSHDMPGGAEMELDAFLACLDGRKLPLAINIKADGLAVPLRKAMEARGVHDWFVFDMAVPDMRAHFQAGNPVFTRMSEVEREPAWLDAASGVWLDSFGDEWYDMALVAGLLARGKRVCIVSSELHGRPHDALWQQLRTLAGTPGLMLCTDLPEQARAFFGEWA